MLFIFEQIIYFFSVAQMCAGSAHLEVVLLKNALAPLAPDGNHLFR